MRNRTVLAASVALALAAMLPLRAYAATEAEKLAAINAGLVYLGTSQNADGSWNTWGGYNAAGTGSAVLAMLEKGNSETAGLYKTNVQSGLAYLFNSATKDSSGRIYWSGEDTYQTGLALSAIASTQTPTAIVGGSGPLAGLTYKQVVEGVVTYFKDGQNANGSWGYGANSGGDNSTTQWPVVGLLFAQSKMGVAVDSSVVSKLSQWTSGIQNLSGNPSTNPAYGASGYTNPYDYNDVSKTGGLLLELYAEGKGLSDSQVQAALGFINRNWVSGGNFAGGPWDGNFGHPYAMWSVYKGLQVQLGLDDNSQITNLNGVQLTDSGRGWNWYEDYSDWLVKNQLANGSWAGYSYWDGPMAAAWDINILLATEVAPPPPSGVPEPGSIALAGLALLALTRIRRTTPA
ncbi:MAG: PEP-CTERM sorting domain-containing protein [Ideonella sp.]|nr:PEP-CTERM sorting domain-containing protein [Ideonella sp.]